MSKKFLGETTRYCKLRYPFDVLFLEARGDLNRLRLVAEEVKNIVLVLFYTVILWEDEEVLPQIG